MIEQKSVAGILEKYAKNSKLPFEKAREKAWKLSREGFFGIAKTSSKKQSKCN